MPMHEEKRRIRHSPDDLYALVSDVKSYPDFVPFVAAMRVRENTENPDGTRSMKAEASVGYKFIRERFATQVELDAKNRVIDVSYLSGPFEALANHWRFHELSDGSTLIDFCVEYEFRNKVLKMLFEGARDRAAGMILDAFKQEADRRYETVGKAKLDLASETVETV